MAARTDTVTVGGRPMRTFVACPKGSGPHPAVVVMCHIGGVDAFTREALALAALDSPGVVHVYAHGEDAGRLYIATQLVPDGDLGAMLQSYGAPPIKVALDSLARLLTRRTEPQVKLH